MRSHFKKNFIFYAIIGLISLYAVNNTEVENGNFTFLETSLVSMLDNVAAKQKFEPVDLGIQNVTLKKISDPTQNFSFYKYAANIVIRNNGGDLVNKQLILQAGANQRHNFVKNDAEGFSLAKDQTYIIENYEILFDGDYNAGKLTVEIKLPEKVDYFEENNKFEVNIFEFPPKIQALSVNSIKNDGTIQLSFDPLVYNISANGFEVYESESLNFEENDSKYAEASADDRTYGYYRIKNSEKLLKNDDWSLVQGTESDPHSIKFSENPFNSTTTHFIYLKSTNPENGNYAVSNIIKLVPQRELNRESFAKSFTDYAGGELVDEEFKVNPESPMTRADALRLVMDYFEVDLSNAGEIQPFKDISPTDTLFPYAKALFNSGKAGVFSENFKPNSVATKNYLKYLIYEYKKNS
jgi:hypothetical protein